MTEDEHDATAIALTLQAQGTERWEPWADLAIFNAACRWEWMTTDEVWRLLADHEAPGCPEPRRIGPAMIHAKGWIVREDRFIDRPPATTRNRRPQRVWKSLIHGRRPAAWPEREPRQ
jgi:hypothetical protein